MAGEEQLSRGATVILGRAAARAGGREDRFMMHWYFDPDGEPMQLREWAELFERRFEDQAPESWWRKRTQIDEEVWVSTVWLGINHRFVDGPPLIWETMIFGGEYDEYCWRYSTRQLAFDNHERIIRALRASEDPSTVAGGV